MVQTWIVRPKGILKDYIQSFELREFDTQGLELKKPIHAALSKPRTTYWMNPVSIQLDNWPIILTWP